MFFVVWGTARSLFQARPVPLGGRGGPPLEGGRGGPPRTKKMLRCAAAGLTAVEFQPALIRERGPAPAHVAIAGCGTFCERLFAGIAPASVVVQMERETHGEHLFAARQTGARKHLRHPVEAAAPAWIRRSVHAPLPISNRQSSARTAADSDRSSCSIAFFGTPLRASTSRCRSSCCSR